MKFPSYCSKGTALGLSALLAGLPVLASFVIQPAQAAALTEASVRLDRMVVSQADNQILVVAKPTTVATEGQVKVTFDTGGTFAVDSTPANITVSTGSLPSTYQGESLTAWPGVGAAATAVSSQEVTFASSDLTVGTLYGFYITAGIDNPGSAGQYSITINTETGAAADIDSSRVGVRVVTSGSPDSDQIEVIGAVPPAINCVLSANSDDFTADLDSGSVETNSGVTYTITTNAAKGWIAWVQTLNSGLLSAVNTYTIPVAGTVNGTVDTLTPGTEGYVLDVDGTTDAPGGGTVTVNAEYDGGANQGGSLSTTLSEIASADGEANGDVLTLTSKAAISGTTPAGEDYTDIQTYICAGNF